MTQHEHEHESRREHEAGQQRGAAVGIAALGAGAAMS